MRISDAHPTGCLLWPVLVVWHLFSSRLACSGRMAQHACSLVACFGRRCRARTWSLSPLRTRCAAPHSFVTRCCWVRTSGSLDCSSSLTMMLWRQLWWLGRLLLGPSLLRLGLGLRWGWGLVCAHGCLLWLFAFVSEGIKKRGRGGSACRGRCSCQHALRRASFHPGFVLNQPQPVSNNPGWTVCVTCRTQGPLLHVHHQQTHNQLSTDYSTDYQPTNHPTTSNMMLAGRAPAPRAPRGQPGARVQCGHTPRTRSHDPLTAGEPAAARGHAPERSTVRTPSPIPFFIRFASYALRLEHTVLRQSTGSRQDLPERGTVRKLS